MEVSKTAVRIDGRCLPSPTLEYANQVADIINGAWNLKRTKFKTPATLSVWMVVDLTRGQDTFKRDRFAAALQKNFNDLGMILLHSSYISLTWIFRHEE